MEENNINNNTVTLFCDGISGVQRVYCVECEVSITMTMSVSGGVCVDSCLESLGDYSHPSPSGLVLPADSSPLGLTYQWGQSWVLCWQGPLG